MAEYVGIMTITGMLCCVFGYPCWPCQDNINENSSESIDDTRTTCKKTEKVSCTLSKNSYIYINNSEPIECPICLEQEPVNDLCMLTSCLHIFHYSCINSWVSFSRIQKFSETKKYCKPRCPCCRFEISVQIK